MNTSRFLYRALAFGVVAEAVCLAVSFGLYALKQGREPMEPAFNWTATVLQMSGIIVSDKLGLFVNYSGWCQWSVTFSFKRCYGASLVSHFFGGRQAGGDEPV